MIFGRPRSHAAIAAALLLSGGVSVAQDNSANSLEPLDPRQWDADRAAHLLRRAGFGGPASEVARLTSAGLEAAVDELVNYHSTFWTNDPPPIDAIVAESPERDELRQMSEEERRAFVEKRRQAEQRTIEEVRLWWIERMIESPRPLEEKMTLFWHGHFTSGAREVKRSVFMYEQNEFLRKHALANFRDLLMGVSRDRAMLVYLDNNRNVKRQPNENYARELMELFSLGVGNYSEADVKAAARAFTGWGFDDEGFRFRRSVHDEGEKTFLGRKGKLDGQDIIDQILEQPACSRFLARALLEFFCRPEPDKELVERFALVIRRNKFDLRPAMRTLFLSKAFYHPRSRGTLIKSPIELIVSTVRAFDLDVGDLQAVERATRAMGQELLQPPNVKGWDGGTKWITTATLFNRYNVTCALLNGAERPGRPRDRRQPSRLAPERPADAPTEAPAATTEPKPAAAATPAMTMQSQPAGGPRVARKARQATYDPLAVVRTEGLSTAEDIVDHSAKRLLANPLPSVKREALVQWLGGEKHDFRADAPDAGRRVRTMLNLLVSTPEYQMN
ncbi:MAG: hypothetical protein CHACPFDD_00069 [Phycisphaerae bacterium]|nr:hypothetical protein [Phycisphaerae bacterium]